MQSRCYRCWRTDSTWPIRLPNDWSIKAFVFQPLPLPRICMRNDRTDHCLARIPSDRPPSICQRGFWVCWGLFHQHTHSARWPRGGTDASDDGRQQPAAGENTSWEARLLLEPLSRRHFRKQRFYFSIPSVSVHLCLVDFLSALSVGCALKWWEKRNFPVAFFFFFLSFPFPIFCSIWAKASRVLSKS